MGTVTSVGSGNYNTGSTWDSGARPGSSDDVVIANGHDVTLVQDENANSLEVESGGTLTVSGGTHKITIDGENSSGFAANINGAIVESGGGKLQLQIETQATTTINIVPSSGNVHHLRLNHASANVFYSGNTTLTGNLNITLGTLNCSNSAGSFTVAGRTDIGPTSGAADQATLTCGDATMSLGALRQQADYAVNIEIGGTFVGGTGTHTFGSLFMAQSANAKATMTTGQVKVNGYNNSANKAWRVEYGGDTFDNANGTVKFQFNGFDSRMSMRSESHANNAFHNLIIHMNGDTRQISPDNGNKIRVDNDLTITRGKLVMGLNHELDVGQDIVIDDASDIAVLEMGSSSNISSQPVTARSITIGSDGTYEGTSGTTIVFNTAASSYAFNNAGTYTPQGGTLQIGNGTTPDGGATHIKSNNYHHLTINTGVSAPNGNVPWRPNSGTEVTIAGDLTVTKGRFYRNNSSNSLVVTGDVDIAANGQVGTEAASGSNTFGSIVIAGKYLATSGTTTLTNKNSSNYMFDNNGTFTHNNGTVHFKADTSSGTWYAMDGASSATETEFYNISTERVRASGTEQYRFWVGGAGKHLTVLNNIDIGENTNVFSSNGSGNFKLLGNCYIRGTTGGLNLDNVTTVNMGTVTIESGGTLEFADGNSINVEGIRNIGGTVQAT